MPVDYAVLAQTPLFSHISPQDIPSMLSCLCASNGTFARGDYISLTGDTLRRIGVVIAGQVHMVKEDLWGGQSIFAVIQEGEAFGESFVSSESLAATVSFCAASRCRVLFLPFSRILHSCARSCGFHQRLIENMVALIASKNLQLIEKLEILSQKTIRDKLLAYLSSQGQTHGGPYFTIPLGRVELAAYLCVDRSALTRELASMKADGLLDYDKNTFRLLEKPPRQARALPSL